MVLPLGSHSAQAREPAFLWGHVYKLSEDIQRDKDWGHVLYDAGSVTQFGRIQILIGREELSRPVGIRRNVP